jgi:hypothetical protein
MAATEHDSCSSDFSKIYDFCFSVHTHATLVGIANARIKHQNGQGSML